MPTFEQLIKNRILCERRFFINNSNSKWISIGISPSTPLLDEASSGFIVDVYLGGEKGAPISLGGIEGAAGLFDAIRAIPQFSNMYSGKKAKYCGHKSQNISVSKANFGTDVSFDYQKNLKTMSLNKCTNDFFLFHRCIKLQTIHSPRNVAG